MKQRRGIARLIEVILASVLLASSLSISYYYLRPANPNVQRGIDDLDKYGYDLLGSLAQKGGFDDTILNQTGVPLPDWQYQLQIALGSMMPVGLIFNVTVYEAVHSSGSISGSDLVVLNVLNTQNITNSVPGAFSYAAQVAQVTFVYTTSSFYTLVFFLQLARTSAR